MTEAIDAGVYANMRLSENLPTEVIHRDGKVSEFDYEIDESIAEVTANTSLGFLSLANMISDPRSRMQAILVVRGGKIVFEAYIGMRPWDNHVWQSAAKPLNGLLLHQLVEEGLVDLDHPVSAYVPDLQATVWEDVPVWSVLHQRSGLDVGELQYGQPGHPVTEFYQAAAGGPDVGPGSSYMESLKAVKKQAEPGTSYRYSSLNAWAVASICEHVAQKTFGELVSERVWRKTGMEGDALLGLSPKGESTAFAILSSRLRDFARFGVLFTPSWRSLATERVVPESYLSSVYAATRPEIFADDYMGKRINQGFGEIGTGQSYLWDAVLPDGDLYKMGRLGQALYISPSTDSVVVWFSAAYKNALWLHPFAREIVLQKMTGSRQLEYRAS
ncbi:class A beta-lactamase-related serine hydrolase [Roseibium hamelinense]|uniref:serine hydrolase domain-containing protein n=1 Tax=Roseibium hamelinense TaxID=150831 RepID=UPI0011A6A2EA|nr:serine hydrolase domain-containing protein [Roseibium hamelinense]MTI44530.1 class A beta-lactamase-related serine hydrolase [Roseibium hamelinense]